MSYWSVVQTESRREQVAAEFLQRDAFEIYYPRIKIERERVAPLFPGYLFVEIIDQWWSVRWTVGVVRLLMMNEQPVKVQVELLHAIRDSEVHGLVHLPEQNPKQKPKPLTRGEAVKVLCGSLAGRIGIFQGQSGAQRSRILLNLLGREVKVTVPTVDVARVCVAAE